MKTPTFELKLMPEAKQDLTEILAFYNSKSPKLGPRFFDALADSMNLIRRFPKIAQRTFGDVRKKPVPKFPFSIFYLANEKAEQIIVVAVLHQKRDQKDWLDRI